MQAIRHTNYPRTTMFLLLIDSEYCISPNSFEEILIRIADMTDFGVMLWSAGCH